MLNRSSIIISLSLTEKERRWVCVYLLNSLLYPHSFMMIIKRLIWVKMHTHEWLHKKGENCPISSSLLIFLFLRCIYSYFQQTKDRIIHLIVICFFLDRPLKSLKKSEKEKMIEFNLRGNHPRWHPPFSLIHILFNWVYWGSK
jgi:hypothetical protein